MAMLSSVSFSVTTCIHFTVFPISMGFSGNRVALPTGRRIWDVELFSIEPRYWFMIRVEFVIFGSSWLLSANDACNDKNKNK